MQSYVSHHAAYAVRDAGVTAVHPRRTPNCAVTGAPSWSVSLPATVSVHVALNSHSEHMSASEYLTPCTTP